MNHAPDGGQLTIDCEGCAMQHTDACDDCMVSFLCRDATSAVVIDLGEVRALKALGDGGLVPQLRHVPT